MVASLAVGAVLVAGCWGGSTPADTAAPATGATSPSHSTAARPSRPAGTPTTTAPSTPAPSPVPGRCPYLDADTVAGTVGQHIARTMVTPTRPYPGCSFYRPNGEPAADVTVSVLSGPIQAQTKAIAIGGQAANPVTGIGDGGAVRVTAEGAVLAVSKSRTLVVVRINQRSSLEAKEIARYVLAGLGPVR